MSLNYSFIFYRSAEFGCLILHFGSDSTLIQTVVAGRSRRSLKIAIYDWCEDWASSIPEGHVDCPIPQKIALLFCWTSVPDGHWYCWLGFGLVPEVRNPAKDSHCAPLSNHYSSNFTRQKILTYDKTLEAMLYVQSTTRTFLHFVRYIADFSFAFFNIFSIVFPILYSNISGITSMSVFLFLLSSNKSTFVPCCCSLFDRSLY